MKRTSTILTLSGLLLLAACHTADQHADLKTVKIGFVVPTLQNPYFVDMTESAKAAAATDSLHPGILVQAPEKVEDAIGQNQMMDNLITQKVQAICVVPTNSESILPEIKKANAAGIPVINVDNKIDTALAAKQGVKVATYVGSDNFDGGKLAGAFMLKKLNGKGKVAILEGVSGNDAAIKRKAGFMSAIQHSPGIQVVASQVANWNREQAFTIFQNILKANPGLDGVFCCNDEMALGASAALQDSKIPKSKLVIVGFDAIKECVDAVNAGKVDATIAQQPKLMGQKAVELALDILNHKNILPSYATDLKLITGK
jgi:ribose transport system substrate-binding protein